MHRIDKFRFGEENEWITAINTIKSRIILTRFAASPAIEQGKLCREVFSVRGTYRL